MNKALIVSNPKHIVPLDGLRGLAILMVVADHGTRDTVLSTKLTEWIRKLMLSGWVGVDLFFVLSGFLITGILLRSKRDPSFFKNFYARRILRIWPLYLAAVAMALVIVPAAMYMRGVDNPAMAALLSRQQYIWLHLVNFGMFFYPGTFRQAPVGVTHFWSLAVEEHYYLLWPFLTYWLSLKNLRRVCVAMFIFAFAIRVTGVLLGLHQYFFTLTFCRLDALAAGALLATYAANEGLKHLAPYARWTLCAAGCVLLTFFFIEKGLWPWHPFIFTIGLSLIALGFSSLLVLTMHGPTSLATAFSFPFLIVCARYSYGWYVIEGMLSRQIDSWVSWTEVLSWTRSVELAVLALLVLKGGAAFLIAVLSWHIFESPILRLKKYFRERPLVQGNQAGAYAPLGATHISH